MAHKIAIALTILALFGGVFASETSWSATTSSFVFAPTAAYDASATGETVVGNSNLAAFGNSSDAAYVYLYLVKIDSSEFTLTRRSLFSENYTAVTSGDDEGAAAGTAPTDGTYKIATATDEVAWAWIDSAKLNFCVAEGGVSVTCGVTTATTANLAIHQLWCNSVDGNCYALCHYDEGTANTYIYTIIGFTKGGDFVWTSKSVDLATQTGACTSANTAAVMWGNSTNASLDGIVNVAFKDCSADASTTNTKYTNIDPSTAAATPASATSITSDDTDKMYTPCGGFVTNTTNGLILCYADTTTGAENYNLTAVFTPSEATIELVYLNASGVDKQFTSANGYFFGEDGGFFLLSSVDDTDSVIYINFYNGTGYNLTDGGLKIGSTDSGNAQWFVTPNSSLALGFSTFAQATSGTFVDADTASTCSIGSIINSVYAGSANVLASFAAFVALMVASLFAF